MKTLVYITLTALLMACGSAIKHQPIALAPVTTASHIAQVWQSSLGGSLQFPLQMSVVGTAMATATSQGTIAVINTANGRDLWRTKFAQEMTSGVGFDGQRIAFTSIDNELVVMQTSTEASAANAVLWRQPLNARVYTAPLMAGGRVFVQLGNRSVQAFDALTGAKLWTLQRTADPLIVSQAGTLGVYRNTLLVGGSGRLLGVNPDNGLVQWETSIATTRATNDIERLIDLVGAPNRVGDSVCVRAYQAGVACVDASKGQTIWSKSTAGAVGVSGDADVMVSTESDGRVKAWHRASGELLWTNELLAFRGLSAPLVIGSSVVVGDFEGYVHVLNKKDGTVTARLKTDGAAIAAAPVAVGTTVIVATAKGNLFAYSPQ